MAGDITLCRAKTGRGFTQLNWMCECCDTLRSIAARAKTEESAGTRGAFGGGGALAQWVQAWRAHPGGQHMAEDARNSTRQRLLFFVAKLETIVEVHRLHRRGVRIPSSHVVAIRLSGLRRHRLSDDTAAHAERILRQAVGDNE